MSEHKHWRKIAAAEKAGRLAAEEEVMQLKRQLSNADKALDSEIARRRRVEGGDREAR